MNYVTLDELESVYACAERISVRRISVPNKELAQFSKAIVMLERSLGELAREDDWHQFLSNAKRFRFDISAALLAEEQLVEKVSQCVDLLEKRARLLKLFYPDQIAKADVLIKELATLPSGRMAHLFDAFVAQFRQVDRCYEGGCAVVVKEARHIAPTSIAVHEIGGLDNWNVVNARELDNVLCFDHIVIIGAARWYPDYLFTAPRARQIDVLVYDFQSSAWEPRSSLVSELVAVRKGRLRAIREFERSRDFSDDDTSDENLGAGAARRLFLRSVQEDEGEAVSAQIVLLEGEHAVLLDSSPGARVLAIDLRTLSEDVVQKIPVSAIEPGVFILLRTDAGGDYIVPLADKLMGPKAKQLREIQVEWKTKLYMKARMQGYQQVVRELNSKGSKTASVQNVRNWMSYRGIKTRAQSDFKAILVCLGMRSKWKVYWDAMVEISNAHRKAGFEMSRLLREEVARSDLTDLRRMGVKRFELAEYEGSEMTAFRVLEVLPEQYEVAPHRIGKPESIEELKY